MLKRLALGILAAILVGGSAFLAGLRMHIHPENQKPGRFPEQLVFVSSADDVVSGGVLFNSPKELSRPLAIIWVHGWGANFYTPSYVGIGRALAERGLPTISANTRMHDIGNVETPNAAITRVTCPVLAFLGSKDDIGGQKELDLLASSVRRLSPGPRQVDTAMIVNGNHEYVGEEAQVVQTIARWAGTVVLGR